MVMKTQMGSSVGVLRDGSIVMKNVGVEKMGDRRGIYLWVMLQIFLLPGSSGTARQLFLPNSTTIQHIDRILP